MKYYRNLLANLIVCFGHKFMIGSKKDIKKQMEWFSFAQTNFVKHLKLMKKKANSKLQYYIWNVDAKIRLVIKRHNLFFSINARVSRLLRRSPFASLEQSRLHASLLLKLLGSMGRKGWNMPALSKTVAGFTRNV